MKRHNVSTEDVQMMVCPQCNKFRMKRPIGHVVSKDETVYKTKNNTEISLLKDICAFCIKNNYIRFFEPSKEDVRKILKTMQTDAQLTDSIENLL